MVPGSIPGATTFFLFFLRSVMSYIPGSMYVSFGIFMLVFQKIIINVENDCPTRDTFGRIHSFAFQQLRSTLNSTT